MTAKPPFDLKWVFFPNGPPPIGADSRWSSLPRFLLRAACNPSLFDILGWQTIPYVLSLVAGRPCATAWPTRLGSYLPLLAAPFPLVAISFFFFFQPYRNLPVHPSMNIIQNDQTVSRTPRSR